MNKLFLKTKENDYCIEKVLLKDSRFQICQNGSIWCRISRNGRGLLADEAWRRIDNLDERGYSRIDMKINGERKTLSVHRIVYAKFCGKLNYNKVVNHKDGNRSNNKPSNLELVEQLYNVSHYHKVLKKK